jgi:hypothetical protein
MSDSRYVIGIDLGTTNSVLAYVDTHAAEEGEAAVKVMSVPQTIAPSVVETKPSLPSFVYLAAGPEFPEGALNLPWADQRDYTVGWLARDQGANVPTRMVASSKSWLCHPTVDRTAPILPWGAPADEVAKISPLEAAVRHLEHLRDAWNYVMAAEDESARLEHQDVYLTVPASFDAVARELTMNAGQRAGFKSVTLLEEPQAAFYAWLSHNGENWRDKLGVGDMVLICDVGGGTTDYTLIAVKEQEGDPRARARRRWRSHPTRRRQHGPRPRAHRRRAAQGSGPEPRCLADAVALVQLPAGEGANPRRRDERESARDHSRRGSKVIGGSIKADLMRDDVHRVLLEGFFPQCQASDRPAAGRRGGLQELGLPYATDAGITRHLARFLGQHGDDGAQVQPTAVLFNGGVMNADPLRHRVTDVVNQWLSAAGREPLKQLDSQSLDLAVSHGAAYYGMVRRGKGIRIRGGVARSYYIGIESAMPAVPGMPAPLKAYCVVPFGMEEGTDSDAGTRQFGMVVGEPVEFRFLSSTVRKDDPIGTMIERWPEGEMEELVPIQTAMHVENEPPGTTIPVKLHSTVTEVGTLDLELRAQDGRSWKLEYEIREKKD